LLEVIGNGLKQRFLPMRRMRRCAVAQGAPKDARWNIFTA
jgi:hypothetical protein